MLEGSVLAAYSLSPIGVLRGNMGLSLLHVELFVDPDDQDIQRTADDTVSLLEQLRQLDIESVQAPASNESPPGTRGAAGYEIGSLVVVAAATKLVLGSLIGLLRDWLARRQSGSIKIKVGDDELTLTYASREAQKQALDAFIERNVR
jgi:Effector Associated Constant Component 1